jgi:hypothetical protein
MKLLIMYFSPASCYFISLRSKSSPQRPVLKHLSLRSSPTLRYQVCTQTIGKIIICVGRAIAQAVSRWLPIAAAWVRAQIRSCGIYGGESGTGIGFLRIHRFPLPIFIPPTAPHSSSSIIRGWYNRVNSGRRTKWTQFHTTTRN